MIMCNMCGKKINDKIGNDMEEYVSLEKNWGYFSNKDSETHTMNICEQCYDIFIAQLKIPVNKTIRKEML